MEPVTTESQGEKKERRGKKASSGAWNWLKSKRGSNALLATIAGAVATGLAVAGIMIPLDDLKQRMGVVESHSKLDPVLDHLEAIDDTLAAIQKADPVGAIATLAPEVKELAGQVGGIRMSLSGDPTTTTTLALTTLALTTVPAAVVSPTVLARLDTAESKLGQLSTSLAAEKESIAVELQSMTRCIEHIKDIVATQQSFAGATKVCEPVQIAELIEDALRMNTASMTRHHIKIVKDFADVPLLQLDKHLVLQILVNLIGNAKQALEGASDRAHQIALRLRMTEPGPTRRLILRVEDSGEGIAPENIVRLFTHGFTTRKHGHGFGLHSCALAAKEMGATLTAHSDGIGQGATFTLDLPAHPTVAAGLS